ncbi:efflux RND transporter periplasmic adaptor subunit [Emcibacter sp.]|uniref:efflux RND transporter periplasmic adaptor subunit n=1 Tax=Emcibacter sp. TaxID=1979954 RepID=UPI002AA8B8DC|nr:efflux RND transporter periplasmic adaptor subunit [Emcibacter sp.]
MKKSYITAAAILLFVILWIASGHIFSGPEISQDQNAGAAVSGTSADKAISVSVSRLSSRPYRREISVRGYTSALRQVEISSQTKGRVVDLPVEVGSRVKAGEIICRLSVDDREANYQEALALKTQRELEYKAALELSAKGYRSETKALEAKALLDAAFAQVTKMKVELDHTLLRAPFDGIINERYVENGTYLKEGESCALLMEEDPFLIVGDVAEKDVTQLRIGQEGSARLADGRSIKGVIRYISSIANAETRTFRVELKVQNTDGSLRDGLTAELLLPADEIQAFYLSPAYFVLNRDGVVGVRIIDDRSIVHFIPLTIQGSDSQGVWVTGPEENSQLIVTGQDFVKEGQKAIAVPLANPALLPEANIDE